LEWGETLIRRMTGYGTQEGQRPYAILKPCPLL
jgi:hypothetical protein